ncbi:hypothetical protein QEH56_02040 [Pelagicoccus enzymogenes]|uniref:hypothetical protein n=1 Tax=Pelagicoccus enzymogenes TaxID=2773457 RepID=UPI00280FD33A|nr:hypothetical protein [Pelagicoccus enzymogenes]MDQ8196906.1 hypothetical protein [Pelagicoccus enzymogenes]
MTKNQIITLATGLLAATHASFANEVTFGGFLSNGYMETSANNYLADTDKGTWDFAEIGLNATWSPLDRTTVRGQLFSFELGPYGNFDPVVDYLFVDYNVAPEFGLRLGRVKRAEGIYTDIQDVDVARTSILLPAGMYDPRYRNFSAAVDGLSLYGNVAAGNGSFDYTIYHGTLDFGTEGGVAGYAQTLIGRSLLDTHVDKVESDTNSGLQIWWNTPLMGLRFGASHSIYKNIEVATSGTHPVFGVPVLIENNSEATWTRFSAEYYVGDWTFVSEFHIEDIDALQRQSVAGTPGAWSPTAQTGESWYVSASRRFLDKFQGGLTYSEYLTDKDASGVGNELDGLQLSLRYDATDNWSLKAEINSFTGLGRIFNQYGQNPEPSESSWTLFAAKSTFSF